MPCLKASLIHASYTHQYRHRSAHTPTEAWEEEGGEGVINEGFDAVEKNPRKLLSFLFGSVQ